MAAAYAWTALVLEIRRETICRLEMAINEKG
jgi:hypothetical protein